MYYAAASIPAVVSTGITFLYFLLKVVSYITNAVSNKAQRREAVTTKGAFMQEYSRDQGGEGSLEIQPQVQGHFRKRTEHGGWPQQPTVGTILLSRRGKDICIPAYTDDSGNSAVSPIQTNEEGLHS